MATRIRLNREQYHQWRMNHSLLLDATGNLVRYATAEEQHESHKFIEHQKVERNNRRNPIRGPLELYKVTHEGVECSLVSYRDHICQMLLEQHGEVLLLDPSNRRLKNIRDPEKRPVPYEQSLGIMPPGDHCQCSGWQGRPPGRHHPACSWAKNEREQAMGTAPMSQSAQQTQQGQESLNLDFRVQGGGRAVSGDSPASHGTDPLIHPERCICKDWVRTPLCRPGGHHSICQYAKAWDAHQQSATVPVAPAATMTEEKSSSDDYFIYDMSTGKKLRKADDDEVLESLDSLEKTKAPTITIDGTQYLVATESVEPPSDTIPPEAEVIPEVVEETAT